MRHIHDDLDLNFDTPLQRWRSEQIILHRLMILTLRDFWFLLDNPDYPHLYDSGMLYLLPEQLVKRPTPKQIDDLNQFLVTHMGMSVKEAQYHIDMARGIEIFRDIPRMEENGGGDCDNWAAARAAEICVAAYRIGAKSRAKPYLVWREDGDRMIYHAKVMHGDGSDEDPSIIMGMGGEDRAPERREECRKNWERYDNMWQRAKMIMADEGLTGNAAYARASELKAAIDSFGYLPKDGVFRVGQPKQQVLGWSDMKRARPARGMDLLGAKHTWRPDCPPLTHCTDVLGRGGHGGHGGRGGFRQSWGFGGGWGVYPQYDLDPVYELPVVFDYDVMSAAPAPSASIVPARRAA